MLSRLYRNADSDLPIIRKHVQHMLELFDLRTKGSFNLDESDHFGFMALCFSYKQLEHAHSIAILVDAGQYADANILARVMLEGLVLLGWASLLPEERGHRWRAYALVSDWKVLVEKKQRGEEVAPEVEQNLKLRLTELGEPFLTSSARKNGIENYPNPYQKSWQVNPDGSKVELSKMIDDLNNPQLKELYENLSQLGHWTPRGIGENIRRDGSGVWLELESKGYAAQACAVTFQVLGHTLEIVSAHLRLGAEIEVQNVFDSYLKELGNSA
jgi:hypothetical protein